MSDLPRKIVFVGDTNVGKSSMILRIVNEEFDERSSISVDYLTKEVSNMKLALWDTAGQERFRTITSSYYKGAEVVVLVYDVSYEASYQSLKHWILETERCASDAAVKILVGNKIDLPNRAVSPDKGEELAQSYGMPYFQVSVKNGDNMDNFFNTIVDKLQNKAGPKAGGTSRVSRATTQSGSEKSSEKKSGGCYLL